MRPAAPYTIPPLWTGWCVGDAPRPISVRDPEEARAVIPDLAGLPVEYLVGLYLDARACLIERRTVAIGSLNVARATPADVLRPALQVNAGGFLIAHNHPSGDPEPSEDDVLFTRSVGRAAALLGVTLWDHLILAGAGLVSLRARGYSWGAD